MEDAALEEHQLTPIWPEDEPSIDIHSALGCRLALPDGWLVRRTSRSIEAQSPTHALARLPAYEFSFHTLRTSLESTLRDAAGAAAVRIDKVRHCGAARSGLILNAAMATAGATLDICAIAERLDDNRHCVVHVVREWSHSTRTARDRMLMIWQHARRSSYAISERNSHLAWINEAAGLQVRLSGAWRADNDEPCLLTARTPGTSPLHPDLLVAVDASRSRPRNVWQMIEQCQTRPQDWRRTRIGNRSALMRSFQQQAGADEIVHQILPDPSEDATVFVELRNTRLDTGEPYETHAGLAVLPQFHWNC